MGKQLTSEEIDRFIKDDQIVIAQSALNQDIPPLHGKFVCADQDPTHYTLRTYKRGVELPFLPADQWLLYEDEK